MSDAQTLERERSAIERVATLEKDNYTLKQRLESAERARGEYAHRVLVAEKQANLPIESACGLLQQLLKEFAVTLVTPPGESKEWTIEINSGKSYMGESLSDAVEGMRKGEFEAEYGVESEGSEGP